MALELAVSGVDAGYGAVRALHGISISIGEKETVALLGTNGNGKSTLMKCIMGMVPPSSGVIRAIVDGERHRPLRRTHHPHHAFQQRALAVAVGAEQGDRLALVHGDRDAVQRAHGAVAGGDVGDGEGEAHSQRQ